jgi:hypothetical protein
MWFRLWYYKGIKEVLSALKHKWIYGECRHICWICEYSNECWDNISYDWKGDK